MRIPKNKHKLHKLFIELKYLERNGKYPPILKESKSLWVDTSPEKFVLIYLNQHILYKGN